MPLSIYQVDAFTDQPFAGNPAAVCLLNEPRDAAWMQSVAAEMNLSETAFLRCVENGYELRWFTPALEVDLCGHATLASAHVLWREGHVGEREAIRFHTRSGTLTATGERGRIALDFPAAPVTESESAPGLLEGLNITPTFVGKTKWDAFVVVDSPAEVRGLQPDFRTLSQVETRGIMVTSRSDDDRYDFISRFFAPAAGIDEDPVTGSAHCSLGPFWAARLGKSELMGYQASTRGGVVGVEVHEDRVVLLGEAVTAMRGELMV
mgnify:CR=1 FL=1